MNLIIFTDTYCNYAWVTPVKDEKGITIAHAFQKPIDKSGSKPSKKLGISQ